MSNLANIISSTRIMLSPVMIWLIMNGHHRIAAIVYLCGWITDSVDGIVARKLNIASDFGVFWDPTCSVMLTYSTMGALVYIGHLNILFPIFAATITGLLQVLMWITKKEETKKLFAISNKIIGGGFVDGGIALFLIVKYIFLP